MRPAGAAGLPDLEAVVAIARKDISVWLRQPASIAATVMPALTFMLVISFAAAAVGRHPVAVVAQDQGPVAQQLLQILEASDAFTVVLDSPDQAVQDLHDLKVAAVITIPAGFDAAFGAGQPDPVTIEINNLNLDFTNDLRRSLPAAITDFYAQRGNNPIDVQVSETDLRAQDIDLAQFNLVPNLVLLLTIAGVINAGLATAREWEESTINELLLAPISRTSLILGKLLSGWLTTVLIGAIVLGLGAATGLLRPAGAFWVSTLVAVLLIALSSVGIGVAVGALARRFQRVAAVSIPVAFYLFFLSGGISVAAFLPDWVQAIALFIPTYYGVHALQMAVFYSSTDQVARDLGVLCATAVAAVVLGVLSLRRRTTA